MTRNRLISLLFSLLCALSVSAWAGEPYWIDVRTDEEYRKEHIKGAVNIPYEEITQRIHEVTSDKDAMIYVYCRSGRRSGSPPSGVRP